MHNLFLVSFSVDGLSTHPCSQTIKNTLKHSFPDVLSNIQFDIDSHSVSFHLKSTDPRHLIASIMTTLTNSGFAVSSHSHELLPSSQVSKAVGPIVTCTPSLNLPVSPSLLFSPSEKTASPPLSTAHLRVSGMTCSACVSSIESLIQGLDGVESVSVSLLTERTSIVFDHTLISPDDFVITITDAGFDASVLSADLNPSLSNFAKCDENVSIDLDIHGMTCTVCSSTIEREISAMPGVLSINISLATKRATITVVAGQVGVRDLILRIEDLGFDALVPDSNIQTQVNSLKRTQEILQWRDAFIWCSAFAIPNMLIGMVLPMVWPAPQNVPKILDRPTPSAFPLDTVHIVPGFSLNQFIQLLLTLPVQFGFVGRKFYRSAYKSLKHGSATMDVLIVLGTSSAFLASIASLLYSITSPKHFPATTFFETCTMLLMFITLGKFLENNAKGKTSSALTKLISLNPSSATLIHTDPKSDDKIISEESISPDLVHVGDLLKVLPGERIPADGDVIFGSTQVDESMVTGEAIPVTKNVGSTVIAGTVNGSGCIHMRAVKVGRDTTLARIFSLVEQAQATKAPIQRWADKVAAVFVPIVISLALLTFVTWMTLSITEGHFPFHYNSEDDSHGNDVFLCLQICISVIVVACPCTLGLSVPTAVMVGTGVGAELGILIKSGESLERIHKLDYIVLDKTGTLTLGKMSVMASEIFVGESSNVTSPDVGGESATLVSSDLSLSEIEFWSIVGATEQNSEHPLASAIAKHANEIKASQRCTLEVQISDFEAVPGDGVRSTATLAPSGRVLDVAIGTLKFLESLDIPTTSAMAHARGIASPVANGADVYSRLKSHSLRGHTVVFVAVAGHLAGLIAIGDQLKPNASQVVQTLSAKMGIEVFMVTGDNAITANVLAQQAGIPPSNVYAGVSPIGKAKFVQTLQQSGKSALASMFPKLESMSILENDYEVKKSGSPMMNNFKLFQFLRSLGAKVKSKFQTSGPPKVYDTLYDLERGRSTSADAGFNASEDTLVTPSPKSATPKSYMPVLSASRAAYKNVVAMVGDGINDSIALAASDIGIALGTGTDVAMEAADIVIIHSSLLDLVVAVDLSRTIFRRIQINFFWAGLYNVVAIPLAMGFGIPFGFMLHPMAAGAAMMFSSISVVLSSLLLKRYKRPAWVTRASENETLSVVCEEVVVLWDESRADNMP